MTPTTVLLLPRQSQRQEQLEGPAMGEGGGRGGGQGCGASHGSRAQQEGSAGANGQQ